MRTRLLSLLLTAICSPSLFAQVLPKQAPIVQDLNAPRCMDRGPASLYIDDACNGISAQGCGGSRPQPGDQCADRLSRVHVAGWRDLKSLWFSQPAQLLQQDGMKISQMKFDICAVEGPCEEGEHPDEGVARCYHPHIILDDINDLTPILGHLSDIDSGSCMGDGFGGVLDFDAWVAGGAIGGGTGGGGGDYDDWYYDNLPDEPYDDGSVDYGEGYGESSSSDPYPDTTVDYGDDYYDDGSSSSSDDYPTDDYYNP